MNRLDIEQVNRRSPYYVQAVSDMEYIFDTDFGVSYQVGFINDESIWETGAYQFYIINANLKSSPNDPKLKDVILRVIDEFFEQNPDILLYVCETGDDKQAARNRLFARWFRETEQSTKYYFNNVEIDADGIENYAAIIVQKSNPELEEIIYKFNEVVETLQNKPQ